MARPKRPSCARRVRSASSAGRARAVRWRRTAHPTERLSSRIGRPSPSGGKTVTSPSVTDLLAVLVCPPHADPSQLRQTSRCRLSTRDAGRRWPPVELVGNLKGFPQSHRPGVVLAGTGQAASQLLAGSAAPGPSGATTSPVGRSPAGSASSPVRHTLTWVGPGRRHAAGCPHAARGGGAACGACGKPEGFSTNPQARCRPGPGAPLTPGGWRAPAAARRPPRVSWYDDAGGLIGPTVRRWPPVELVGNLKGFPQIHRPGVVLAPALR